MIDIQTEAGSEAGQPSRVLVGGRLDGTTAPELEQHLMAAIGDGQGKVVIDFSPLEYISSAGLRVILMGAKKTKQGGGAFAICGLGEVIRNVFQMSGFLSMIKEYPDFETAKTSM